jgi:uncharacterized repeat protein (TIGR01451 family)
LKLIDILTHSLESIGEGQMSRELYLLTAVLILAVCIVGLLGTVPVRAGTIFTVDDTADAPDADPGDGACATLADRCTLRAAIMETNALVGADTIVLPSGVYTLTIAGSGEDMAAMGDLDIADDLSVEGAGAESTRIDGNSSQVNDRVVHVIGSGVKVVVTGVTVQGGREAGDAGGGIRADGELSLENAAVVENIGDGVSGHVLTVTNSLVGHNTGRGIRCESCRLTVVDSTILENEKSGIQVQYGDVSVIRSMIHDNGERGIWGFDVDLLVESSTIRGHTYGEGGSGIGLNGTATISNSVISDNIASWAGGGIRCDGNLVVIRSTICGNTTGSYGGGIYANRGLQIADSTVCSNTASLGGGIYVGAATSLTNATVSGNSANEHGGGIAVGGGLVHINNVTFTGNRADADSDGSGDAGGIYVTPGYAVYAANSIIAGNFDSSSGTQYADCSGTLLSSQGHNLIQDTSGCFIGGVTTGNLAGVNPLVGPLQDNGGPTLTHALLAHSPAIDAANPAGCTDQMGNPLLTDQRGRSRLGRCDMGAYEVTFLDTARKAASTSAALPGESVTYTIALHNGEAVDVTSVQVTDTLPISLTYLKDSLAATSGGFGYANRVITWAGSLSANTSVLITFGAAISETVPRGTDIMNAATISGAGETITRTATVFVGHQIHLPVVMKVDG